MEERELRQQFDKNCQQLRYHNVRKIALDKLFDLYKIFHKEDCGVVKMHINADESMNSILGFEQIELEQPKFNNYIKDILKTRPIWKFYKGIKNPTARVYELLRNIGIKPVKCSRGPKKHDVNRRDFMYSTKYVYIEDYFEKNKYRLGVNTPKRTAKIPPSKLPPLKNKTVCDVLRQSSNALPSIHELFKNELQCSQAHIYNECITHMRAELRDLIDLDIDSIFNCKKDVEFVDKTPIPQYINKNLSEASFIERDRLLQKIQEHIQSGIITPNSARRLIIVYNILFHLQRKDRCLITTSQDLKKNSPIFGWKRIYFKNPIEFILMMKIIIMEDWDGLWLKISGKKKPRNPSWYIYELMRKICIKPSIRILQDNKDIPSNDKLYYKSWYYMPRKNIL